jgi:hypothetical protein
MILGFSTNVRIKKKKKEDIDDVLFPPSVDKHAISIGLVLNKKAKTDTYYFTLEVFDSNGMFSINDYPFDRWVMRILIILSKYIKYTWLPQLLIPDENHIMFPLEYMLNFGQGQCDFLAIMYAIGRSHLNKKELSEKFNSLIYFTDEKPKYDNIKKWYSSILEKYIKPRKKIVPIQEIIDLPNTPLNYNNINDTCSTYNFNTLFPLYQTSRSDNSIEHLPLRDVECPTINYMETDQSKIPSESTSKMSSVSSSKSDSVLSSKSGSESDSESYSKSASVSGSESDSESASVSGRDSTSESDSESTSISGRDSTSESDSESESESDKNVINCNIQ